jgi:ATP sulfurylase
VSKEILCTLGPASYNEQVIVRLAEFNVSLFRINLSHTAYEDLEGRINFIRRYSDVPICLDTEGAQIRTGNFVENAVLREHSVVRVHTRRVPGDAKDFNLYPLDIVKDLQIADFILIDFNAVLAQVIGFEQGRSIAVLRVINGGPIGRNKAVTVERDIPLPVLTEKDRRAIELGNRLNIRHVALSFANQGSDVDLVRSLAAPGTFIISKIECLNGLEHLSEIAARSDALLIDRGDLSRQVPMEQIPRTQKQIIKTCKEIGRKVYVATNLLESMIHSLAPTRAEVNDIHNTLLDGADGLVLAAETAIGAHPLRCVAMIVKMIGDFERPSVVLSRLPTDPISLLVEPHGGTLVQRYASAEEKHEAETLPRFDVGQTDLMDCSQLANGTYSPLTGFMDLETLESVLRDYRLPNGIKWTLPILLQISPGQAITPRVGARIALGLTGGVVHSIIDIEQMFSYDPGKLAQQWFGTNDTAHPGVSRLMAGGHLFVAGPVTLVGQQASEYSQYELTPAQTRFIFNHKGWSRVVGFHTRNPPHRSHEYIQLQAMAQTHADGLYISPVVGPKKQNDFLPGPIFNSYQRMIEFGVYPAGKVVLGSFSTYSRYSGPREAVFTALCRKNMGCSHFIIGRDHTGVGDFYHPDANHKLFVSMGDLGIEIVQFGEVGYDPKLGHYREADNQDGIITISGTQAREALRNQAGLPSWFMRDIVQDVLRAEISDGHAFVE